jgi:hypothetical protein
LDGDGYTKVIWFPRSWTSSDKSGVKEFVLIVLTIDVSIKELISIVKIGVPLSSELSTGVQPRSEVSKKLSVCVGDDAEKSLPICPKEDGWCWLVSSVVCGGRVTRVKFTLFNTGYELVADGISDVRNCDYTKIMAAVVDDACFFRSEGVAPGDQIHEIGV